jgi:RNA polymerase sigma-70 factor (ECF subfamily)
VQTEDEVPEPPELAESSAEDQAMDSLGQAGMLALIERLSTEQRQVLTLKFLFGFANAEVAGILGKTEGAVKSLQHRALASLQKHVSPV